VNQPVKSGISFGLTSGVITTLGLMVGLHSGTHSVLAVVGGILTIAVADAMSDALGMHVSLEAQNVYSTRHVWQSTLATFVTKFLMALTFVVPVLLLELGMAIAVSIVWGLVVVALLSYRMARVQGVAPWTVIGEHLLIAVVVIAVTHFVGDLAAEWVGAGA
jgi:VIT1/CCC1 family predicted Fe2+/Mn2+ transporter